MSLIIELGPELETRVRQEAVKRGTEPEDLARRLIEQQLPPQEAQEQSLWVTLSPEEWARQTREWAESHRDWPILPPEAMERESIYEDERL